MSIESIIKRAVADHIVVQGRENMLRDLILAETTPEGLLPGADYALPYGTDRLDTAKHTIVTAPEPTEDEKKEIAFVKSSGIDGDVGDWTSVPGEGLAYPGDLVNYHSGTEETFSSPTAGHIPTQAEADAAALPDYVHAPVDADPINPAVDNPSAYGEGVEHAS